MKKTFFILAVLMSLIVANSYAQCFGPSTSKSTPTSIGIVIYSNDVETIWNALRFANFAKDEGGRGCDFFAWQRG